MGSKEWRRVGAVGVSLVLWAALAGGASGVAAAGWNVTGASVYNGCPGAWGDVCGGGGFAELGGGGGVLMGGLEPGTVITIRYRGREVVSRKLDWGTGGAYVAGVPRGIDLPCSTAARLGIFDCRYWTGIVRWQMGRRRARMDAWRPGVLPRRLCVSGERAGRRGCVPRRLGGARRGRGGSFALSDG